MNKAFIINAHQPHPISEGKLNREVARRISEDLKEKGYEVKYTAITDKYDLEEEVKRHVWADVVIIQTPVYWMCVPWLMKKYIDEVYTAGLSGALCNTDGRTPEAPKKNYGTGGSLKGKKYMLSLTFNAPEEAFNDSKEYLFQGKSVDDLLFWVHMNFRFFSMEPLATFACYDVLKNADIENDFKRLEKHLNQYFPVSDTQKQTA